VLGSEQMDACACACVCVCFCVRACLRMCMSVCACECVCACVLTRKGACTVCVPHYCTGGILHRIECT